MSQAANRSNRAKTRTVARISPSSTTITASAGPGACRPKKTGVQAALTSNCQPQSRMARQAQLSATARRHTRQAATAIIAYNTVQTGPNSQLGGVPGGWCKTAYQP